MSKHHHRFIDDRGYEHVVPNHSSLTHRIIAYNRIYLPNRDKYPLEFGEYVVHHINGNKRDNHIANLMIITQEKHEEIHGRNYKIKPDTFFDVVYGDNDLKDSDFTYQMYKIAPVIFLFGAAVTFVGLVLNAFSMIEYYIIFPVGIMVVGAAIIFYLVGIVDGFFRYRDNWTRE